MSRAKHSTLTHGNPAEVADILDSEECDDSQLRAALINALRRIDVLERQVAQQRLTGNE